jgi:small subunit ribosomal protein S8
MNIETIKFLIKLKNASTANQESFNSNVNKLSQNLLKILYREGFVLSFRIKKQDSSFGINNTTSTINLRYLYNKSMWRHLKIVSSPSKRRYFCLKSISRISSKKNLFVFSTNKGLLTLNECKKLKVGGVLLFIC